MAIHYDEMHNMDTAATRVVVRDDASSKGPNMYYSYEKERETTFTEDGQVMLLKIRDNAFRLIELSGAATVERIIQGVGGDSWHMLACVDRLAEIGDLKEVQMAQPVRGQDRIFIRPKQA